MAEAAGEALTLERAVEVIDRAKGFEEPLRRRTEGVTWMVWGLVLAGIFLGYAASDALYRPLYRILGDAVASFLLSLEWVPWLAVGAAGTKAVWRIAGIAAPSLGQRERRSTVASLALFVIVAVMWLLLYFVIRSSAAAFVAFGAIWLLVGGLDLYKATPIGRRVLLTIGIATMVLGVASWSLVSAGPNTNWSWFFLLGALIAGGVPILGGLWQTLRG